MNALMKQMQAWLGPHTTAIKALMAPVFIIMVLSLRLVRHWRPNTVATGSRIMQLLSACALSVSHGMNDAQKSCCTANRDEQKPARRFSLNPAGVSAWSLHRKPCISR